MALIATDRLDLIRLFLRVAETGQISEAARALGLSQPTASRFLKRLETLLGTQLVDRSPQGLSLTQAGQDFLTPARQLVDGWHDAVDAINADKPSISGTLRVVVPIAIGQGFLAAIAARFLCAHPEAAIEWHLRDDAVDVTASGYDCGSAPARSTATIWWCATSIASNARSLWRRTGRRTGPRSPTRASFNQWRQCACPPSFRVLLN